MPQKIRQLNAALRQAGFEMLAGRGKGDHAVWRHPLVPTYQLTIDGQAGDDAKPYQEKAVRAALAALATAQRAENESE